MAEAAFDHPAGAAAYGASKAAAVAMTYGKGRIFHNAEGHDVTGMPPEWPDLVS